ncbi:MAG: glucosamine-6-phosphate deaminase [Candidatus Bipolaricaulota bacterium]|nr:glucosamine-6-phosphate deaminase [Candidatus Bipolaricaulota bacterium]MDW8126775.1 glucosamine-6-phosphate deaminase [Candidatus Bipolaricaulota bacterium]
MEAVILRNCVDVSREAARRIAKLILQKPDAVLALPTGETPRKLYRILVQYARLGIVNFEKVTVFNLDEYLGLPRGHPLSFRHYMREHFLSFVSVGAHYIPDSAAADPEAECARYEDLIAKVGGIDLAVLGLGINGHIAFNEPGTPFESRTHVAILAPETRQRLAKDFGGLEKTPMQAITMGIKTIMNARSIILMVCGKEKEEALRRALFGPISSTLPASILQLHPDVIVLADFEAASGIANRP